MLLKFASLIHITVRTVVHGSPSLVTTGTSASFFDKSSRCWKKREEGFEEFDFDQEDVGENLWTALGSDTVDSNDGFIDHMSQSDDDQADITFDDEPNTAFVYVSYVYSNMCYHLYLCTIIAM